MPCCALFKICTAANSACVRACAEGLLSSGDASSDPRELFIVKESLALMLQMLRRHDRCMEVYAELLVLAGPPGALPAADWPLPPGAGTADELERAVPVVRQHAADVTAYSINTLRTRVLRTGST